MKNEPLFEPLINHSMLQLNRYSAEDNFVVIFGGLHIGMAVSKPLVSGSKDLNGYNHFCKWIFQWHEQLFPLLSSICYAEKKKAYLNTDAALCTL